MTTGFPQALLNRTLDLLDPRGKTPRVKPDLKVALGPLEDRHASLPNSGARDISSESIA